MELSTYRPRVDADPRQGTHAKDVAADGSRSGQRCPGAAPTSRSPPPPLIPPADNDARAPPPRVSATCDNTTTIGRECDCRNRPPSLVIAPRDRQSHLTCTFPSRATIPTFLRPATMATTTEACSPLDSSDLSSLSTSRSSSPLSSLGRRTPSPPPELFVNNMHPDNHKKARTSSQLLPTPPPSQENSQSGSPAPDAADSSMLSDKDGPPPAKRRRVGPRERTTRSLDLNHEGIKSAEQPQFDDMLRTLHRCKKIVVIAGAGISVSAGIPDFRSSTGLFNSLKAEHKLKGSGKDLFDASVYRDATSTSSFHTMVSSMSRMTKDAKPTDFHHMLATLAQEGRLLRLYSQNVDGIDTSLEPLQTRIPLEKDGKGKWPKTVQLHGGLDKMVCSKCNELSDFDADLFDGPIAPICGNCETVNDIRTNHQGKRSHGIGRLRPRMVLYNEHNPDDEAIGKVASEDLRRRPDAVIVVGTTLKVPGVQRITREMCNVVRNRKDGMAIWINNDPPPSGIQFSDCWDLVVRGPADAVANHAAMRKWDDPVNAAELDNISDEEVIKKAEKKTASVVVPRQDLPEHLEEIPLPEGYINNSFRPPTESPTTPRHQRAADRSPDFSPATSRRPSVMPSIEGGIDGDNITVAESGLLTPSKSQRNSTPMLASAFDTMKGKASGKPQKGPAKKTKAAPKKQTTGKPGRPAKAKAPAKTTKQKPITSGVSLKASFSSSKSSVAESDEKKPDSGAKKMPGPYPEPPKLPSKLAQVSNMSPDTLHPLSPSDPRNNLSPKISRSTLSSDAHAPKSAHPSSAEGTKKTMSVANLMN
ncbi:hypothetical protein Q7P37_001110 [Cladosporium fusiforme]